MRKMFLHFLLLGLLTAAATAAAQEVIAEKYGETDWDFRTGCTTLQVSGKIQSTFHSMRPSLRDPPSPLPRLG